MRRKIIWPTDFQVKGSLFKKPYTTERSEMHMESPPIPDLDLTLPDLTLPDLVPRHHPPYTPPTRGPLPAITYPPRDDPDNPGSLTPSGEPLDDLLPDVPPDSDTPLPGISLRIKPYCYIETTGKCNAVGESFIVRAQMQHYTYPPTWKATVSNKSLVAVSLLEAQGGTASIMVTILSELIEAVTVCIYARTIKKGFFKKVATYSVLAANIKVKGSRYLELECGCFEVEACCPPVTALAWDSVTSPATMTRGSDETVYVLGGKGPYSWTISGTGFTLLDAVTTDQLNVITADGTACGTAEITVTDDCGGTVTGYVREPDTDFSEWGATAITTCIIPGEWESQSAGYFYVTRDQYQMRVKHLQLQSCAPACASGGNCADLCGGGDCSAQCQGCSSGSPCMKCITNFNPGWDFSDFPCFLSNSCGGGLWRSQQCWCNDDIIVKEWVCK